MSSRSRIALKRYHTNWLPFLAIRVLRCHSSPRRSASADHSGALAERVRVWSENRIRSASNADFNRQNITARTLLLATPSADDDPDMDPVDTRVASKSELKARILACLDGINAEPVIHT
jgi:hypothetical protein